MPRYFIEIHHADDHEGCIMSLDAIHKFGGHLVTHAEFGCEDDVHSGWLIAELGSREEALQIIPPQFRIDARVVKLRKWSKEEIEAMVKSL